MSNNRQATHVIRARKRFPQIIEIGKHLGLHDPIPCPKWVLCIGMPFPKLDERRLCYDVHSSQ